MEVRFHPLVKRDMAEALGYYDGVSKRLVEEFREEVLVIIAEAAANPLRFHSAEQNFRRANLRRFPHILYEIRSDVLFVMHIRHNKRHPDYGMERR